MSFSEKTYEPTAARSMVKQSNWITGLLKILASGGAAVGTDRLVNGDWISSDSDGMRWANLGLNTAIYRGAGHYAKGGDLLKATGMVASVPTKDLAFAATGAMPDVRKALHRYANEQPLGNQGSNSTAADGGKAILKGNDWATATAIGALGLGALGLGGYGIYKWLQARDEDKARASKMKMRIKTPNGDDAVVEMPLVNPNMSPQLESDFNRGVTRGVRQIARHNSFKRDPQTGKLMSYKDWYDQYGRLEEQGMSNGVEHQEKAAKVVGIPTINLLENTVPKAKETPWRPVVPGKVRQMLDLEKAASRARQTNEGIGSITAPLLTAALLGGGAKLMGASNGAALGAAGAGAIGAPLLGAAVSSFTPDRAQSEQSNIDADGNGWENIVVPGLAQYNMLQRARVLPDALAVNVRKATGDPMPDLDGDGEPDVIPERMTITSDNLLSLDDSDFGMYSKK